MSWTDERVDLLKKLWSEGLSASQIAGRLGGVTRNAVIGKVHRLGLSGRATTSRIKSLRPRTSRVPAAPKRQPVRGRNGVSGNPAVRALYEPSSEPFLPVEDELVIPMAERKSIQSLTENSCRWPIGDPQHDDFHFCGKNKVPGLAYCEHHARRAFQPPQARRRAPVGIAPVPAKPAVTVEASSEETADA